MKNIALLSLCLVSIAIFFTSCTCQKKIVIDHIGYSDKYVPTVYISTDTFEIELFDYFILVNESKFAELKEYISNIDEKYSTPMDTLSWWDFHVKVSSCGDNYERYLDGFNSIILFEGIIDILSDVEMSEYSRFELTYTLSRIKRGMSFIRSQ